MLQLLQTIFVCLLKIVLQNINGWFPKGQDLVPATLHQVIQDHATQAQLGRDHQGKEQFFSSGKENIIV